MSMSDRIRILLIKCGNLSEAELARCMGMSSQNFNNKMERDNFTDKVLRLIDKTLGCTYKNAFVTANGEEV